MTRAWVEIDLGALRRNGAALAARSSGLVPMIKADAYGLGAIPIAHALERLSPPPWGFGVATAAEGAELREAGIERPIIVFTPALPADFPALCHARLTPALGSASDITRWATMNAPAPPWHLAIDTGMNRAGVQWDAIDSLRHALSAAPPEGAFTHFHSAELDDGSREIQERRFELAIARLPARPRFLHTENSAALARTTRSRWDLARPGIFLYGVGSGPGALIHPDPVAHVRARVVDIRTTSQGETVSYDATYHVTSERRIATIAIGYADGYRRASSNRGIVLLHGHTVPVVGLVTMDMTMIDVTGVDCAVGDTATLIGRDGDALLDVESVARRAELSPYELLTGLRGRLERVYIDEERGA